MKLITNTIICLIIAFASNMLSMQYVFAEDTEQQTTTEEDIIIGDEFTAPVLAVDNTENQN